MENKIRELAIRLLDDDFGISEEAWYLLNFLLIKEENRNENLDNDDIIQAVKCIEGRVYLPEGWSQTYGET